jgi:hypothetical protein
MRSPAWFPLSGIDPRRLTEARLQAHHAVQWLARAARAYVPPQPDDGHTSLGWDRPLGGFATHPLADGARLSLRLTDLTLGLHAGAAGDAALFSLEGRRDADARQWLGGELAARGFDAAALDAPSPYEMPAYAVSQGTPYGPAGLAEALAELAAWFGNAALSLGAVHGRMTARHLEASPVRCWPHHFDLATLITLAERDPTGYVGAGLSPGDDYYDEPYFYVSVHPKPDPAALPALPPPGHWHLRDFTGAVAAAHSIAAAQDPQAETDDFLRAAVDGALKILLWEGPAATHLAGPDPRDL